MRNFFKSLFALAAVAALVLAPQPARAYLLAYEGFDYAAGSDLTGMNGGFGWTTPWGINSSGATIAGANPGDTAAAGSLTYIDSLNHMLYTSGNSAFYTGSAGTSSPFRDFFGNTGEEGTTIWVSFLAQRVGPTTNNTGTPFNPYPRAGNVSLFDGNSERLAIGNASGAVSNKFALLPAGSGGNIRASTNDYSTLSLAVVRIDYGPTNNDTAYLFINPTLGIEPSTSTASASTNNFNFTFLRVRPFAGANDAANSRPYADLKVDEIRIGTTWQDVTPFITIVPEPSVITIAGLGALGVWLRSRRNRR